MKKIIIRNNIKNINCIYFKIKYKYYINLFTNKINL